MGRTLLKGVFGRHGAWSAWGMVGRGMDCMVGMGHGLLGAWSVDFTGKASSVALNAGHKFTKKAPSITDGALCCE